MQNSESLDTKQRFTEALLGNRKKWEGKVDHLINKKLHNIYTSPNAVLVSK